MKKKFILALCLTAFLVIALAICVQAASTNEFGAPEVIDGIDLTGMSGDTSARIVVKDGEEYHTYPAQYFVTMDIGQGDIVAVHYEACDNLHEVLAEIRQRGASPFVAISPDTVPEVLADFLDELDGVIVMTVYPGFAGRPIVEGSFDKIKAVRNLLDSRREGILLEVDGHVSWDLCQKMRACGGDMFVAGSSSLYQKGLDLEQAVERMRALIS